MPDKGPEKMIESPHQRRVAAKMSQQKGMNFKRVLAAVPDRGSL